jgi:hypothetical protein
MFISQDDGADNQPNSHLDPLTNPKANEVEITSQSGWHQNVGPFKINSPSLDVCLTGSERVIEIQRG